MKLRSTVFATLAPVLVAASVHAATVQVQITGTVEWNQFGNPPLNGIQFGDAATLTFLLDSNLFDDSPNFPTRGYVIDQSSFNLTLGSVSLGMQTPFPIGETPYFVLRNNDPAVDGFFIADNTDWPTGVPMNETAAFGNVVSGFSVGYDGDTLDSLDILDAVGTYDFTGLTSFNFVVSDGSFDPIGILFDQMTISAVAGVPGDLNGDGVVNVMDLLQLLGEWGQCDDCNHCAADLDDNCNVNVIDLLLLLGNWG